MTSKALGIAWVHNTTTIALNITYIVYDSYDLLAGIARDILSHTLATDYILLANMRLHANCLRVMFYKHTVIIIHICLLKYHGGVMPFAIRVTSRKKHKLTISFGLVLAFAFHSIISLVYISLRKQNNASRKQTLKLAITLAGGLQTYK